MSDHDSIYSNDQDIQSRTVSLSDITTDNVNDILHEQFSRFHPSLPAATLVHNTPYFLSSGDIIKKFGLSQIQFEALYQIIMSNKLGITTITKTTTMILILNSSKTKNSLGFITSSKKQCA